MHALYSKFRRIWADGLPTHPRTGLQAIGTIGGRPVWPVMGASEAAPEAPTEEVPEESPDSPTPPADDAPESEWKKYARKWEGIAKSRQATPDLKADPKYREALAKAKKLDDLEAANATELEKAQKAADDAAQRAQAATDRAVRAEVKALAGGFINPNDALSNLGDLSRFVGEDGEVDDKAISKELADILKANAHYAKPDPAAEPPKPDPKKLAGRPAESLKPGAVPDADQRPKSLADAISAHYQN